ncbi:hypothetical protein MJO29_015731 [Puccinia striiformis f. sp. tritici]|nr:hypothetical protein MJO29_015731 [Puccinia striiformis f. sp. tritici]
MIHQISTRSCSTNNHLKSFPKLNDDIDFAFSRPYFNDDIVYRNSVAAAIPFLLAALLLAPLQPEFRSRSSLTPPHYKRGSLPRFLSFPSCKDLKSQSLHHLHLLLGFKPTAIFSSVDYRLHINHPQSQSLHHLHLLLGFKPTAILSSVDYRLHINHPHRPCQSFINKTQSPSLARSTSLSSRPNPYSFPLVRKERSLFILHTFSIRY